MSSALISRNRDDYRALAGLLEGPAVRYLMATLHVDPDRVLALARLLLDPPPADADAKIKAVEDESALATLRSLVRHSKVAARAFTRVGVVPKHAQNVIERMHREARTGG